jgi:hypothetical protein
MSLASLNREFSGSLFHFVRQWIVVMRNPSRFRCAFVAWSPILDDRTGIVIFLHRIVIAITLACIVVTQCLNIHLAKPVMVIPSFSFRGRHGFGVID